MTLLALFPLELVLLPGTPLPLHIFEPRYKEMITECLEQRKPFGVVRASFDGVADIGCTAEIMSVTKKYDDGRMDILTRGVERFEVVEVNQDRSFLQAEISVVQDEVEDDKPNQPTTQMAMQAVRLTRRSRSYPGRSLTASIKTLAIFPSCWRDRYHSISISSRSCSQPCRKRNGWRQ